MNPRVRKGLFRDFRRGHALGWGAKALLKATLIIGFLLPAGAMTMEWIGVWMSLQVTAASGTLPRRTIDANTADWLDTMPNSMPYIGNTAILKSDGKETEWVWRDKLYDARDDFSVWGDNRANWDIKEVRMIADTTYLYLFVAVDWWHGWNGANTGDDKFVFNIAIDTEIATNPSGGTSGFNWFGDDANTSLGNSSQYSEINLSLCKSGIYNFHSASWDYIGAYGTDITFNQAGGFMEARMKWSDLGFASVPPRLRFTMASAYRKHWGAPDPDDDDKTVPVPNGTLPDMLDAVSPGKYNSTDEWNDELSDANVSSYVDVAFDAKGNCVNPKLPAAPANLRVYDPTQAAWIASGDTVQTNNPILAWDPVPPDGDSGDSIVGYYIQVCTSAVVNADGFFHSDFNSMIALNTNGAGPDNKIVYHNNYTPQAWWGTSDSSSGIPNGDGLGHPILALGQTYYIRVWARDRRGMLGAPSATYVLPVDYPAWHDPYTFAENGSTFRSNRDPKEGAEVNFMVGVFDPPPGDPMDNYYVNPATGQMAPNEILNVILHIRVAKVGHPTYDWAAGAAKIPLGDEWKASNGDIAWYLPSVPNSLGVKDPPDSFSVWRTGGNIDLAKTWVYKRTKINLGTGGDPTTFYLDAQVGDVIEYFFEFNNPYEAPGGNYGFSHAPRRYLYSYDPNGITGYRYGAYDQAKTHAFRFVVQKRDLPAVWHNPLSQEVPLGPLGSSYAMRNPLWPDTAPQSVTMSVGAIGAIGVNWQMVWRKIGAGGWSSDAFNGATVQVDTSRHLYYSSHAFAYTGGMIEYYFKSSDNQIYIFANGITDNPNIVYESSMGSDGKDTLPFKFPFTSQVRVISTASTGKDSHSIVALINFRTARFDAFDENAIGVNGVLNLSADSVSVVGNVFTNVFPGAHNSRSDIPGSPEPRNLFGRSYMALLTGVTNAVLGIRKAFFGPIFPFDYAVTDTASWNTGSDVYENIPLLAFEVFSEVIERREPAGTIFSGAQPLEGVVYVDGDAQISTLTVTRGALIASGSITIPSGAIVSASRLDLVALGGEIKIGGRLEIDTGMLFSNQAINVDAGATLKLKELGSVVAQSLTIDSGSTLSVSHPASSGGFIAAKETVLARATRWVISSLRESR